MFETIKNILSGLSWSSLILIVLLIWYVARHGLPAALSLAGTVGTKLSSLWRAGVDDVKAVQTTLAGDVAILKNDVEAIKTHLGLALPPTASQTHPGA